MPKKFIPYFPDTIEGQAILNNVTRTKRILKYRDSDKVYERIKRGLPLYDVETIEQVRKSPSSQDGIYSPPLGECNASRKKLQLIKNYLDNDFSCEI